MRWSDTKSWVTLLLIFKLRIVLVELIPSTFHVIYKRITDIYLQKQLHNKNRTTLECSSRISLEPSSDLEIVPGLTSILTFNPKSFCEYAWFSAISKSRQMPRFEWKCSWCINQDTISPNQLTLNIFVIKKMQFWPWNFIDVII